MHSLIHIGLELGFVAIISIVFTLFIAKRPGREKSMTKRGLVIALVVGAFIGVVFLVSGDLYVTPDA